VIRHCARAKLKLACQVRCLMNGRREFTSIHRA
jgi:hypothetical protein